MINFIPQYTTVSDIKCLISVLMVLNSISHITKPRCLVLTDIHQVIKSRFGFLSTTNIYKKVYNFSLCKIHCSIPNILKKNKINVQRRDVEM